MEQDAGTARYWIFLTLTVFALTSILWAQCRAPVLQYFYFLRFPLLIGLALLGFTPLALYALPNLLRNLFVVNSSGVGVITFLTFLTAWTVMVTTFLIAQFSPIRFQVKPLPLPNWVVRFRVIVFAVLALPIVTSTVYHSVKESSSSLTRALSGALVGVLLARLILQLARFIVPEVFARRPGPSIHTDSSEDRSGGFWEGYVDEKTGQFFRGHKFASVVLAVTLLIYGVGYWALNPGFNEPIVSVPALTYLLLLLILLGWGLTGASFFLDRYRISTLLVLVAASFLFYTVSDTDHYYLLQETTDEAPSLDQIINDWRDNQVFERNPTMVVVAAGGGGIRAAMWTAQVLTGLQEELGSEFTRSIRLVSSVSGGSVGAMYFLDAYQNGPPLKESLEEIVEAAGASSLDATAWGIVYPDLIRAICGPLVFDKTLDRGWAIEQAWRRYLQLREASVSDWRLGIRQGWRPIPIFNGTIVENGERFLLSPIKLPGFRQAKNFLDEYPKKDVSVSTAARLSATFPYVSPIARAWWPGRRDVAHIADGGYYDNFGVLTLVELLDTLIKEYGKNLPAKKILIVEIRASTYVSKPLPKGRRGWLYSTIGPLLTLMNVRTSTQTSRNDVEIELLRERWRETIPMKSFVFELRDDGPLSWKLTELEKEAIRREWIREKNRHEMEDLNLKMWFM